MTYASQSNEIEDVCVNIVSTQSVASHVGINNVSVNIEMIQRGASIVDRL